MSALDTPSFDAADATSKVLANDNHVDSFAESKREEAIAFVLEVGLALHNAGAPSHRLEDVMERMSDVLELKGSFFSTPTSLQAMFGKRSPTTVLLRTQPGTVHLGLLAEIDRVAQAAAEGKLSPRDGLRALAEIQSDRDRRDARWWHALSPAVSGALVSGSAAKMLGGGGGDVVTGLLLGVVVAVVGRQFNQRPRFARVSDLAATVLCVLGAHAVAGYFPIHVEMVALAGIIVLVPGFTLTVALTELATRHLVSGTARLCAAGMTFLQIAVGYAMASKIAAVFPDALAPTAGVTDVFFDGIAVALAGVGVARLMSARSAATGWIVIGVGIAVYTARALSPSFGPELAAGAAAFALALFANFYAHQLQRPASEVLSPGIILLVPGAIGFVSLRALLHSDVLAGVSGVFTMTMVGAAIVVGLLTANAVIPPRRLL